MNATGIVDLGNEPNAVFMLEDELVGQTVALSMHGRRPGTPLKQPTETGESGSFSQSGVTANHDCGCRG